MKKVFESNLLSGLDQEVAKLEERLFEAEEKLAYVAGWLAGFEPDIQIIEYRTEVPGRYSGLPENCYPAEPEEVEFEWSIAPENMPTPTELREVCDEVLGYEFHTDRALEMAREEMSDV